MKILIQNTGADSVIRENADTGPYTASRKKGKKTDMGRKKLDKTLINSSINVIIISVIICE